MKYVLLVLAVAFAVAWVGERVGGAAHQSALRDSVRVARQDRERWQARVAELETALDAKAETVRVAVTRFRTVRDSVRLTDTVWVKEFVRVSDSTVRACSDLLTSCESFRASSGSLVRSLEVERDFWKRRYESSRPSFWDRLSVNCGYGVTRVRHNVYAGEQCGAHFQIWPAP